MRVCTARVVNADASGTRRTAPQRLLLTSTSFKSLANSTASRRRTAAIGVLSAAATPASNNTTPMSRNGVVGSAAVINGSMTTQSGSGVVGSGGSGDKPDGAVHPQRRLKIRQCARATRRSLLSGERRDSTDTGSLIATGRITVLGGTDASTTQGLSTTEPSGRRIVS